MQNNPPAKPCHENGRRSETRSQGKDNDELDEDEDADARDEDLFETPPQFDPFGMKRKGRLRRRNDRISRRWCF